MFRAHLALRTPHHNINMENSLSLVRPSWRSYLRAVLAIARKDWLHFQRYPLNAIFKVVEPITWLTPVYFLGQSFGATGGGAGFAEYAGTPDYMSFILVGVILSNYVAAVFWGMGFALKLDMDAGLLESNWLTPLPRPLFLVGQTVASLVMTTVTSAGVLVVAWLLFGFRPAGDVWAAALVTVLVLAALYGLGFAFAALALLTKDPTNLIDVSNFLVTQLSGSQFPVRALPRVLLPLALAMPLTYGYDLVRGFLLNAETLLPVPYEIAILLVFMVVTIALGYAVFTRVERYVRRAGTLATH